MLELNLQLVGWAATKPVYNDFHLVPIPQQQTWPGGTDFESDLVANIYDGDTLILEANVNNILAYQLVLCTYGMPCSISIVGMGAGYLVRMRQGSIVCLVENGCKDVSFKNVLKVECMDPSPSQAIVIIDGANLEISNTVFLNCQSQSDGGAIQSYGGATLTISSSRFENCYSEGSGGGISCVGADLLISDTVFSNCSSQASGGAIHASKLVRYPSDAISLACTVNDVLFQDCVAQGTGGGISISAGNAVISGTSFIHCLAYVSGGALYTDQGTNLKTSLSIFKSNVALGVGGGAVHVKETLSAFVGLNCSDNRASAGGGGVIFWEGNIPNLFCAAGAYNAEFNYVVDPTGPTCVLCQVGTFSSVIGALSQRNCSACAAGTYSTIEGSSACESCEAGKFSISTQASSVVVCTSCRPGAFQSLAGKSTCNFCAPGQYSSSYGASVCQQCPSGTFSTPPASISNKSCAICPSGAYSEMGSSTCFVCSAGKYSTGSGIPGTDGCKKCPAGTYSKVPGKSTCHSCSPGNYSRSGAVSCEECTLGTFSNVNASAFCLQCKMGKFSNSTGQTACFDCSSSRYFSNTTTIICSNYSTNYPIELCPSPINMVCLSQDDCTRGIIGRYVPNGTYNSNEGTTWIIGSEGASSVTLTFTEFSTEPGYDTVAIYSCMNITCESWTLINIFSGLGLPEPQVSDTGIMKIVWSSDTCCPKRSGCYCDNPIYCFILSGWLATFSIAGASSCSSDQYKIRRSNVVLDQHEKLERSISQLYKEGGSLPAKFSANLQAIQSREIKTTAGFFHRCHAIECRPVRTRLWMQGLIASLRSLADLQAPAVPVHQFLRSAELGSSLRKLRTLCGPNNSAVYGDCLASVYHALQVFDLPTSHNPANPGLPFSVLVQKQDFYGQVIATDSVSILQAHSSFNDKLDSDPSVTLTGTILSVLQQGQAFFSVMLKPTFVSVSMREERTTLVSQPAIYFKGLDTQATTSAAMVSSAKKIFIANSTAVCPLGFILSLDQTESNTLGQGGSCLECGPGTYSVNPLAGISDTVPSCFNCPPSGVCKGGSDVQFSIGKWEIILGIYRLVGCPPGHQLVNSIDGVFSHDIQDCLSCPQSDYIVNTDNSSYTCQTCPIGATCNGNTLTSLVDGAVWVADISAGIFVLESCPAGYQRQGQSMQTQQCVTCPPSYYCSGGTNPSSECPENTFAPAGANSSSACIASVMVSVKVLLPMTQVDFTPLQSAFVSALAASVGIDTKLVVLESVAAQSRRSVGSSIQVISDLATSDASAAAALTGRINLDSLNTQLVARGLPSATSAVASVLSAATPSNTSISDVVGGSIGGFLFVLILAATAFFISRKIMEQYAFRIFLTRLRGAQCGDLASSEYLPLKLKKEYIPEVVLGRGSFGCVLKAKTRQDGIPVAIKLIIPERGIFDDKEMRQLGREANVLDLYTSNKTEHAVHFAGIHSVNLEQHLCWFIMEWLDGESMDNVLRGQEGETAFLSDLECIKAASNILAALKVLHAEGIVHRDIKPANIMRCTQEKNRKWRSIGSGGPGTKFIEPAKTTKSRVRTSILAQQVSVEAERIEAVSDSKPQRHDSNYIYKLIDFGTALGVDDAVARETMMTLSSSRVMGAGTPPYMSPEMFKEPEKAMYPSDLWSLGVTLFEFVTGSLPFQAESDLLWGIAIAGNIDERAPSVLDILVGDRRSNFDNNLSKVISKSLEKRVENRRVKPDKREVG